MRTLFDRTQIGSMKLKNRIFMSPMGTTGEADGAYCNEGIDYFEERAKGGAGLLITAVTYGMYHFQFAGKSIIIYFGVLHCLPDGGDFHFFHT